MLLRNRIYASAGINVHLFRLPLIRVVGSVGVDLSNGKHSTLLSFSLATIAFYGRRTKRQRFAIPHWLDCRCVCVSSTTYRRVTTRFQRNYLHRPSPRVKICRLGGAQFLFRIVCLWIFVTRVHEHFQYSNTGSIPDRDHYDTGGGEPYQQYHLGETVAIDRCLNGRCMWKFLM